MSHPSTKIFSAIILSIGFALAGFFIGHAIVKHQYFNRYVNVKGLAERVVKADQAQWAIEFTYASDDIGDLYNGIDKTQMEIKKFLQERGFSAEEISTEPVNINDNSASSYTNNSKVKRYSASCKINLVTSKVKQVQEAVQKVSSLVKQGVLLSNNSINYKYTKLNDIKQQMLITATKNAQKAAKVFAQNSQSTLGGIRNSSQGMFSIINLIGSSYSDSSVMKKVRVVSTIGYFLKG